MRTWRTESGGLACALFLLIVVGVFALVFAVQAALAWLLMAVYGAMAPETWPHMGFWPALGIVVLVSALFGAGTRVVKEK